LVRSIIKQDQGNPRMQEIQTAIEEGALAFLYREYKTLIFFIALVTLVFIVLGVMGYMSPYLFIAYLLGTLCSVGAGYIGMRIAVKANVRTTASAMHSLNRGLRVAFSSGAVMGISVVGFGILGLSIIYLIFRGPEVINIIVGFSFGASSIALFARVGGGIFTKAADVGSDLVGKVEMNIPEDDPRNAAVIADNVGDNVGDVAGMGADLFESYVGSIIAAMALSAVAFDAPKMLLPLLVAALGIISAIIGTFFVRVGEEAKMEGLLMALRRGIWIASFLVAALTFGAIIWLGLPVGIFWAVLAGLIAGILIGLSVEYYTSYSYSPTKAVAEAARTGTGTIIIRGFATAMQSTWIPAVVVVAAVLVAHKFAGLYGVAISAVGMLSTLGITLATDAYGPVADNAGGIAQQAALPPEVRERTDALDSLGNTTAATGKGFAIGSAALTALALMAAFAGTVEKLMQDKLGDPGYSFAVSLLEPEVISGLLIGAMLVFLFCALTMNAVGKAAFQIVEEVRRQFREIKGLWEGTARAEYGRCVDISTRTALREMIFPGALAILVPIAVGLFLGPQALGGLLIGAISSGFMVAITMANAGGTWDNAKKWIEAGNLGGKGSEPHKAAVVGDTVGDPFKDTSGPSLNILIKLMSIVSLVFAPVFVAVA
jgi:K(+)-stimulated pyrophosphate-energized sodium pump